MGYTLAQLQSMGATPGPTISPSVSPTTTTTKKRYTYDELVKAGATPSTTTGVDKYPAPPPQENWAVGMAKGLVSAPATILARPFQAVAMAAGASPEDIDKFSSKYSLGTVAPVPTSYGDVAKDVGRGVQTVAFGVGAPLAAGAAFGAGASLERQGTDILSISGAGQAALETALGLGAGKLLSVVGKPIINAAGKVIGTVTPLGLQKLASQGTKAVEEFAATHKILPDVISKQVNKIPVAAEAFDTGVNKLFKGSGSTVGKTITSQYPGLSKEGVEGYYSKKEIADFTKPTTIPKAAYNDATDIYKAAKGKGIDLAKVAVRSKITHESIKDGKVYNTVDTANAIRNDAMKTSHDLIRPALEEAAPGVERVKMNEIGNKMLAEARSIPASKITDADRAKVVSGIIKEYGANSAANRAHPNGYDLVNLHDAKISTSLGAKYTPTGSIADRLSARQKQIESNVFKTLLEKNAPPELDIGAFNKKIGEQFQLADYLEALNNKPAPVTITRKVGTLFVQMVGAGTGGMIGGGVAGSGVLGRIGGYHLGGILMDNFQGLSNPLKAAVLRRMAVENPEIFQAFKAYVGEQAYSRLMRLKLPAANKVDIGLSKVMNPDGTITMGAPLFKSNKFANDVEQNARILGNTKQLPAPNPNVIIPPNTQWTPNKISSLYNRGGDQGAVGGVVQRIKPKR